MLIVLSNKETVAISTKVDHKLITFLTVGKSIKVALDVVLTINKLEQLAKNV